MALAVPLWHGIPRMHIICASTSVSLLTVCAVCSQGSDNKIRYQTMHDNKYIRYFSGHTEKVTGLCLSPKNDMFLSAALVRTSDCLGRAGWDDFDPAFPTA